MAEEVKGPCIKVGKLVDLLKKLDRDMDVAIAFPVLTKEQLVRFSGKSEEEIESRFFGNNDPSSWSPDFYSDYDDDDDEEDDDEYEENNSNYFDDGHILKESLFGPLIGVYRFPASDFSEDINPNGSNEILVLLVNNDSVKNAEIGGIEDDDE